MNILNFLYYSIKKKLNYNIIFDNIVEKKKKLEMDDSLNEMDKTEEEKPNVISCKQSLIVVIYIV